MQHGMCAGPCACGLYMPAQNCALSVCMISPRVQSVWETGRALIDESAFVLTSLQSGFTLRQIWLLTLRCFYCCLEISEEYTISLLLVYLCACSRS